MLGHDSDADLGYVSTHDHPVDVMRESFRLQRRLTELGFPVTRYSGGAFKVHVREADGHDRGLDVFAGFMREGVLYLMGEVATPFRREWIYPTTTAYLSGRPFPVAADPDRFLTLAYGAGWRSPDPAFRFSTPASTIRRFDGWFRGMRVGRAHWDRYYSKPHRRRLREPSSLAREVNDRAEFATYIDLGCGRGEDVRFVASQGRRAVGLDGVPRGYAEIARETADDPSVEFQQVNVLETRQLLAVSAWAARLPGPRVVVVRHLVESLTARGRQETWRASRMMLAGTDGRLYVEFLVRRGKDGYAKDAGVRKRRRRREVFGELAAAGATIESEHVYDVSDHPRPARVCRVVARFDKHVDKSVDQSPEQEGRPLKATVKKAKTLWDRGIPGTDPELRRRVAALEREVQECRALNVRLAELTDIVDRAAAAGRGPRRGGVAAPARQVPRGVLLSGRPGRAGPRRVFFHIGLPKTGTTYLQTVLWEGARRLRRDGIVLPGSGHREHLWAALDLQGRRLDRRDPRANGAWSRLVGEAQGHDDTVLLTHEFFCTASKNRRSERSRPSPTPRCTSSSPHATRAACCSRAGRKR